jgi:hypothetical protein
MNSLHQRNQAKRQRGHLAGRSTAMLAGAHGILGPLPQ